MNKHTTHDLSPKLCECGCGQPVANPKNRFLQGHNSKAAGFTPEERFRQHLARGLFTDCWEWQGATRNGYGVMNIDHTVVYAHRFSYELHHGSVPDGMYVCHTCDNRLCANPYHLFLGTHADNIRDMYAKGRGNPSRQGSKPKVTADDVRQIRLRGAQGVSYTVLAEEYGVTKANICLIVKRKRWSHIP